MNKKLFLITVVFLLVLNFAIAQEETKNQVPFGISIFIEEDSINKKFNYDRNYKGGGAISIVGPFTESNWFVAPIFRRGSEIIQVQF